MKSAPKAAEGIHLTIHSVALGILVIHKHDHSMVQVHERFQPEPFEPLVVPDQASEFGVLEASVVRACGVSLVDRGFERGDCGQRDPVVGLVIAQLCGRLTMADGGESGVPSAGGIAQFGHREHS